ncbi:GNAT family N-acetyltransferase [Rhizobium leguminosarum]|uniref:GNAT family N-acetyltransferase n=1 Tax=Rhizobium leguminosarum TaxID=384 RepID=UPI0015B8D94A|nr:GNAT family N-acetyltransferase [Rhizobium leguminosarum]
MIETTRLKLRHFADHHRSPFAEMHADPEVMADLGGPIDNVESDLKFARYLAAQAEHGVARWAVEDVEGNFLGYCGVMPRMDPKHPLGSHYEVGWRFRRGVWGNGYAFESARAALSHAIHDIGLDQIVSYTSVDNLRSQSVMRKLALVRDSSRDFTIRTSTSRPWQGLVWLVPVESWPRS